MTFSRFGLQSCDVHFKILRHHFLDVVDRNLFFGVLDELVDNLLGERQGEFLSIERSLAISEMSTPSSSRTFVLMFFAIYSTIFFRYLYPVAEHFALQYADSGFVIRSSEFCRKPPLESRKQSLFNILHIHRCLVRSQDHLFPVLMEVIEDMEETSWYPIFRRGIAHRRRSICHHCRSE